jgi:acyl-CoA thioesterase
MTSGLDKLDQPGLDHPRLDRPGLDADAVAELARSAAADPAREFGSFFLSRFLRLGISYDDAEQTCTVVLPYGAHLCNPQGSVHGGIVTTALDISMGHLCKRYLSTAVTIEMQMRFFRPLTSDATCTGRVVRAGRRIVHLESRMTGADGRLTALGTGSWHRLDAG